MPGARSAVVHPTDIWISEYTGRVKQQAADNSSQVMSEFMGATTDHYVQVAYATGVQMMRHSRMKSDMLVPPATSQMGGATRACQPWRRLAVQIVALAGIPCSVLTDDLLVCVWPVLGRFLLLCIVFISSVTRVQLT